MRLSAARETTISNRPRARHPRNPAARRAFGPTAPQQEWAMEAAASDGNRYAIPTAAWKTPLAFPTATHSPDDDELNYTPSAERRTQNTDKADTFN